MSENGETQRALTLEDLERFLALPLQSFALEDENLPDTALQSVELEDEGIPGLSPSSMTTPGQPRPALMRYLDAAAVLEAFDPLELQPAPPSTNHQERESVLDHLLSLSEQIVDGPLHGLWSLAFVERRATLRRLRTREQMRLALDANPDRPHTPAQRMFEQVLNGTPFALAQLSRDELAALITVVEWTTGILDNLPDTTTLQSALARADLLAPMQRLTGNGFVNRRQELRQLERYVFSAQSRRPLFVFGPGGVGKSTLLAHFILKHLAPSAVPFAYIDIDRPTIRPDLPLTILLEIITQLQRQMDIPGEATSSLISEITYNLGRADVARPFESLGSSRELTWHFNLLGNLLERFSPTQVPIVIFLDTFEEAQFFGPDVVQLLLEFLVELHQSLDRYRVIMSGRALPSEFVSLVFPYLSPMPDGVGIDHESALDRIALPWRPINLAVLEQEPAQELLTTTIQDAGLDALSANEMNDVIGLVGCNPMCLKLAARLLRDEGIEKLRKARSEFFTKLRAEKIQALLYGRILNHIHGEDTRKIAYPGLIVRRMTAEVIREVLAQPCGLKLTPERNEHTIFWELHKEAALVEIDRWDGSLRHRTDVRRAMLADLTEHVEPEIVRQIDEAAVAFYAQQSDSIARAEEMYHRLRLGQDTDILNWRWLPEAAERLKDVGEELPAQQRLWLAEKLGITLDETVRQAASQEAWEDQAGRTATRFLQSRSAQRALDVLHERPTRLPRSQLYFIEADAYRSLHDLDQAMRVARSGIEALSRAGAIDMVLTLQLQMVNIAEAQRDLPQAETLLAEAETIAAHTHNQLLQLRVEVTNLRLQRRRPDYAHDESVGLRKAVLAQLTEEMLIKLRSQPVLLREVAAELGADNPWIVQAAVETLGLEANTDEQAAALGHAIWLLRDRMTIDPGLAAAADEFERANFDPEVIRDWVTNKPSTIATRRFSRSLGQGLLSSDVQDAFQAYFRAGVDSVLCISKQ